MAHLLLHKELVLVKILYFMPDHRLILNEFVWQTEDVWPTIPRIHKFLDYWKENIQAPINMIEIQSAQSRRWRSVDTLKEFQ